MKISKIEMIKELMLGDDTDLVFVIEAVNNDPLYSGPELPSRGKTVVLARSLLSVPKAILTSAIEGLDADEELDDEDEDYETQSNPRKSISVRGQSLRSADIIEVDAEDVDDESEEEEESEYEEEDTYEEESEDEDTDEDEDEDEDVDTDVEDDDEPKRIIQKSSPYKKR